MIVAALKAAVGIVPSKLPNTTTGANEKVPAQNVEMRVRAADAFTPIII